MANPWDLQTAFNHPASVKPGDTIWVRGGTYFGSYVVKLVGSPSQPIIVRNYKEERVTIDGLSDHKHLAIIESRGSDTWLWGLEIMSSFPKRIGYACPAAPESWAWRHATRDFPQ